MTASPHGLARDRPEQEVGSPDLLSNLSLCDLQRLRAIELITEPGNYVPAPQVSIT